uniref:Uncharacterized protein n=1 Tax=Oncorhynchus tshawytscha TaxID=74940 RepID=A0A8C8LVK3_ONCTS
MGPQILKRFYSCTIEIILTGCITAWYGNCSASNRKALQRALHHWGQASCHPGPLYQAVSEEGTKNCLVLIYVSFVLNLPFSQCVQAVFRSLSSLEKTVEKCHIDFPLTMAYCVCVCAVGRLKSHNLSFQDSESLQAVFDEESHANVLRAPSPGHVPFGFHWAVVRLVHVSTCTVRFWLSCHCGFVTDSVLEVNFVAVIPLCTGSCSLPRIPSSLPRARLPPAPDDSTSDNIDSYLIAMETSELAGPSDQPLSRSPNQIESNLSLSIPALFRSLFFGSVCPTDSQLTNQRIKSQEVLASDSEDDTPNKTNTIFLS